jgi:hypothetical protein
MFKLNSFFKYISYSNLSQLAFSNSMSRYFSHELFGFISVGQESKYDIVRRFSPKSLIMSTREELCVVAVMDSDDDWSVEIEIKMEDSSNEHHRQEERRRSERRSKIWRVICFCASICFWSVRTTAWECRRFFAKTVTITFCRVGKGFSLKRST